MGLMDSIKNTIQSGLQSAGPMEAMMLLLNQSGGIHGLIQSFHQQGLGQIMESWIGTGPNLPIEPKQLQSVIGDERLAQMSQKSGVPSGDLLHQLARNLPQVIDKLTPDGNVQQDRFSGANLLNIGKMFFH